jgi:hypothetical protein
MRNGERAHYIGPHLIGGGPLAIKRFPCPSFIMGERGMGGTTHLFHQTIKSTKEMTLTYQQHGPIASRDYWVLFSPNMSYPEK